MDIRPLTALMVIVGGASYAGVGFLAIVLSTLAAIVQYLPAGPSTVFLQTRLDLTVYSMILSLAVADMVCSYVILRHAKAMSRTSGDHPKTSAVTVGASFLGLAAAFLMIAIGSVSQSTFFDYFIVAPFITILPWAFIAVLAGIYADSWSDRTA